jgi:transcription factor IIIB 90 kDa subunit
MTTSRVPHSVTPLPLPLTSYLLTASSSTLSLSHIPTRLQLLVAERDGGADDVGDDELFAEGELDDFLRSEDEVEGLRRVLGWEEGKEEPDSAEKTGKGPKSATKKSGTKRVDMDAFAKLLQGSLDGDKNDTDHLDFDITNTAGPEEIEEWRPLSPECKDALAYDDMDRYEEAC